MDAIVDTACHGAATVPRQTTAASRLPQYSVERVSDPGAIQEIYRLRYEVLTAELGKYSAAADHAHQRLFDELDRHCNQYRITCDGELVGAMQILAGAQHATPAMHRDLGLADFLGQVRAEEICFSGRLVIARSYRKSAALARLFDHCYRDMRANGIRVDIVYRKPHLIKLYEQLGYRCYRPHFEDPELGLEVPMAFVTGDIDYLKTNGSAFYFAARRLPIDTELSSWFDALCRDYPVSAGPVSVSREELAQLIAQSINEKRPGLLSDLDDAEHADLLRAATRLTFPIGSRVIRRGEFGHEMYLIVSGCAEAQVRRSEGPDLRLASFGAGDVFGEMAILSERPRSADVVATSNLDLVLLDDACIKRLMAHKPAMAAKVMFNLARVFARRLENSSDQLVRAAI